MMLCLAGHALMDNRHGLIINAALTASVGVTEPAAALALLERQRRKRLRPKSVGADNAYHTQRFVSAVLAERTAAHVADVEARNVGLVEGALESPATEPARSCARRACTACEAMRN